MEIVCKHCNTSHYLSDDKIPLATKIGKCKHCHADIIVLGKNDSSLPTTHSIPPEQQASKRCDFCGEKILAVAKKCKYCSSVLNGSASASQNVLEKPIKPATEHTVLPTQVKETAPPHTKKTPIFLIVGSLLAIDGLITAFIISKQNLTVTPNEQPNTTAILTPEPIKKANDTPQYPAGLRLPTAQELAKEPTGKASPTQNASVEADFNGDGKPDYAILLASINTSKGTLAVKLSNHDNYEWKIIDNELDWNAEPMAIDLAEPNTYQTACGKGYWECAANEPSSITLANAGFFYSPFEQGGAVMIFWNRAKNDFTQILMND